MWAGERGQTGGREGGVASRETVTEPSSTSLLYNSPAEVLKSHGAKSLFS